jgi:hypothetical protein
MVPQVAVAMFQAMMGLNYLPVAAAVVPNKVAL